MINRITDIMAWAETAEEGDFLASYDNVKVSKTAPGYYTVHHKATWRAVWEGEIEEADDHDQRKGGQYEAAERAASSDTGKRCGWTDDELAEADRVLGRSGLFIQGDYYGLYAARIK